MGFLKTLGSLASGAWAAIFGGSGSFTSTLQKFWSYITGLHGLLGWLISDPLLAAVRAILHLAQIMEKGLEALRDALGRIGNWVWVHQVYPVEKLLLARIAGLRAWTQLQLQIMRRMVITLYFAAEAYTRMLVGQERQQRVAAIKSEHASMLANIRALHQAIEKEAASGYTTGTPDRKTIIKSLLTDLAGRNPAVKALAGDLIKIVVDLDTIDNPLLRYAASKLLTEIIDHLGIDKVISDLIGRLIGPLAGDPRPAGVYDVEKDVAARLAALEQQWSDFMADGGPELEQAGKGWKDGGSLVVDAAILAFAGLAVSDPNAWSTGVADTIGAGAAAAMTSIVDLIQHA